MQNCFIEPQIAVMQDGSFELFFVWHRWLASGCDDLNLK